ncbi:hypothetical protein CA267_012095 [Alteromonas pelagimontana]|uniref:Uncharacterized protein n=1 Tax=Alteromonas pelagimontana TaxID=1858656 RepID=A0A6M4MF25_9ALTE|nr:hypothetical protein [Alteromonas pelagimontana]QJR81468.1 hypothetical protein CA267_012095 [Alteromonas pelagimontana]
MRFNKTVEFEAELFVISALMPMLAASVCCFIYYLMTRNVPNMWVVGVTFNVCWIISLRECMLSCYLQGQSDAVSQSPYLKPHIRNEIPSSGQATETQKTVL